MIKSLPYYFPIAMLCVDDDEDVIAASTNRFRKLFPGRRVFGVHSGEEALKSIGENPFQFSLTEIRNSYANFQAQKEIAGRKGHEHTLDVIQQYANGFGIMVVDYDMRNDMNGLELASVVSCVGKILLTGQATNDQAINAFNAAIIDRYVRKDVVKAGEVVAGHIRSLEEDFFAFINSEMAEMSSDDLRFLKDQQASETLAKLCDGLGVKLMGPSFDPPGLMLQLNKGEKIMIMVFDDIDIEVQLGITEDEIDSSLAQKMRDRKAIYFRKFDQPKLRVYKAGHDNDGVYRLQELSPGFYTSVIRLDAAGGDE